MEELGVERGCGLGRCHRLAQVLEHDGIEPVDRRTLLKSAKPFSGPTCLM